MTLFFRPLDRCILCCSAKLDLRLPLRPIPVSSPNSKALSDSAAAREQVAPLDLMQCQECGHLQVSSVVDPEFLYRNYRYRTAISVGLGEHFSRLTDEVCHRLHMEAGDTVIEIGSNDGTQLGFFKAKGMRVLGIDPGTAIAASATAKGIETIAEFFTKSLAATICSRYGKARLLIANNVIANIPDISDVMHGICSLLTDDGVFVFETQYGSNVITDNLLDTIYHEHLSYFLIKPLVNFFTGLGMELIHVLRVPTKGGSIRVSVQRRGGPHRPDPAVAAMIDGENQRGLYSPEIYQRLAARIADSRTKLLSFVKSCRDAHRAVAGYGVSIGTSCQLHQFDLWDKIDFLVDDDAEKVGMLAGPGYEIPVFPSSLLAEKNPSAVVVFAWRYADRIIASHPQYGQQGGKFVIPLPDFAIR